MTVTVTLPDGNALELPDEATGADAAAAIGPGLARAALAVAVGDGVAGTTPEVRDLALALPDGAHLSIITAKSGEQALELIRHDAAHVLAAAVMELYEGVKISIGPPIAEGFYYDFEFPPGTVISEADFPKIEERMRTHIKAAESFERQDVSVAAARARFLAAGQDYKVELIDDLVAAASASAPLTTVSLYTNGPFTDLCRGPHAPSTASVGAFRLSSVAGAYWRGDSTRTMLTRIYGTAFFSKASWPSTSSGSSRPRRATTASSDASSACSPSPTSLQAPPSGCLPARASSTRSCGSRARWARAAATARSRRRRSSIRSCGRPLGTGASTARTCSPSRSRTARWASSR